MIVSQYSQSPSVFGGRRVQLDPQPARHASAALEVVMLGHCPGEANLDVLLSDSAMRADMEAAGYASVLDTLDQSGFPSDPLFDIPVPLRSVTQFQALFPNADRPARYSSRIASNYAWLPRAVADFFEPFGGEVPKTLWIINVDQSRMQEGFLPGPDDDWLQPENNSAFTRALMLPRVGLMAMPDLERLQIPAQLKGVPRLRIDNPVPRFLPCDANGDDGVRERRTADETFDVQPPRDFGQMVVPLLKALGRYRPDMHLLMALPFDDEPDAELPRVAGAALTDIEHLQQGQWRHHLHRMQLTFPYLRSARTPVISASGLLAGVMAATTAIKGPWRSTAGQPLPGLYQCFPRMPLPQVVRLRDELGVGVLCALDTKVQLDDERLPGAVFGGMADYLRSGEVARFLGWLRRQLENLGHEMLFDVSPGDPRALILLRNFFTRLHRRGALRGRLPEDAFRIRETTSGGLMAFDIELAPAFPIDRIRFTFSRERLEVHND